MRAAQGGGTYFPPAAKQDASPARVLSLSGRGGPEWPGRLLATWLFLILTVGAPHSAEATGIAPQVSVLTLRPGESGKIMVSVLQYRQPEFEVSLVPEHAVLDKEGRLIFAERFADLGLAAEERTYSAVRFIRPEKVKLKGNEWKTVPLAVTVPKGTPPGEYYAAVVARPTSLVSLVSVVVEPRDLRAGCRVASVDVRVVNNELVISGILENTGSRTIIPSVVAMIRREGKVVDAVSLSLSGRQYDFLQHHARRQFSGTIQNILPVANNYTAEVVVRYGTEERASGEKAFSVERDLYLRQQGLKTVQASPSAAKLALPPGGFYLFPVSVKNVSPDPVTFKVYATDSWAVPAVGEGTLQPGETRVISVALTAPRSFDQLETNLLVVPGRGHAYRTAIRVYPMQGEH
jgi:hypothetical protein